MTDQFFPIIGDEAELPFYVAGIGSHDLEHHIKRDEGYANSQVLYCVRGQGKLIVDGQEFIVNPGQGFYLEKDYPHEYYPTQEVWETHWVTFGGREIPEMMKILRFGKWRFFDISNVSAIDVIFKKTLHMFKNERFYTGYQCSVLLYNFLIELHRYVNCQTSPNESVKIKQLAPVIDYLDEHYMEEIELSTLSELIGLSPQYLCRIFKDCFNIRPFEYLARKRVQEAKNLLLEKDDTVNEISKRVGYKDCSYFCSVFKRHEMLSPAEFRMLHKTH